MLYRVKHCYNRELLRTYKCNWWLVSGYRRELSVVRFHRQFSVFHTYYKSQCLTSIDLLGSVLEGICPTLWFSRPPFPLYIFFLHLQTYVLFCRLWLSRRGPFFPKYGLLPIIIPFYRNLWLVITHV